MRSARLIRPLLTLGLLLAGGCGDESPSGQDPDGFNLRIEAAYLVQATQRRAGSVPLVAGRDAYARIFAIANDENTATPSVRVSILHAGDEVATYDLPARSSTVVRTVDQENANTSWNVKIPGELIRPGLQFLAQVDPGDRFVEGSETDNFFPVNGAPQEIAVYEVRAFNLTVVPIHQSVNGRTGDVRLANLEDFLSFARKVHPIGQMQVTLREPFTTDLPAVDPEGDVWQRVLSELEALRQAEGVESDYYYGVVNTSYRGGGVVGIANGIPSRSALGWDRFPDAPQTLAHELGHNFGRYHVPCGGAAGADPDYPYDTGFLGVYGMDVETGEVKDPFGFTDIMGYCNEDTWWVSDYTYKAVLEHRLEHERLHAATSRSSLLVWGRVGADGIVLEPAFEIDAPGSLPTPRGDYRVEGLAEDGSTLFSYSFTPSSVSDGPDGVKTFALRLPVAEATAERIAVLRVSGEGRSASISRRAGEPSGRGLVLPGARPPIRRIDAGTVELSWDPNRYRMVMVRDAETGRVLSFARGGDARITARAGELELSYSDGVRSASRRVTIGQ